MDKNILINYWNIIFLQIYFKYIFRHFNLLLEIEFKYYLNKLIAEDIFMTLNYLKFYTNKHLLHFISILFKIIKYSLYLFQNLQIHKNIYRKFLSNLNDVLFFHLPQRYIE